MTLKTYISLFRKKKQYINEDYLLILRYIFAVFAVAQSNYLLHPLLCVCPPARAKSSRSAGLILNNKLLPHNISH